MLCLNKGSSLACSFCAVLEQGDIDLKPSPNLLEACENPVYGRHLGTHYMRSGEVVRQTIVEEIETTASVPSMCISAPPGRGSIPQDQRPLRTLDRLPHSVTCFLQKVSFHLPPKNFHFHED